MECKLLLSETEDRRTSDNQYGLSIIHFIYASVRHSQSNGQVERVNSTLVPVLQSNMQDDNIWGKNILEVQSQLNNVKNKTTGDTPFRLLHGYYDGILRHTVIEEQHTDVM